ncbi:multidrug efflux SMR transporter [uncultured Campylobacter sp.]|uniref:DMT family transporter n=1 Tax=uncultured Campylobacter sp. TaxID=218934 RepID=UPI0026303E30|nr:multidrug efflux SMR transporter [uncultured Campylobacter sp.]
MKKKISANFAWFSVLFGGFVEIFWVSGLKYSQSILEYCLTAIGVLISFICMLLAVKRLEVSIAYAVFVGIGTAGVVLSEMLVFAESVSLIKIILIGILLLGVIGLKLVSKEQGEKSDEDLAQELSKNLGIDELEEILGEKK